MAAYSAGIQDRNEHVQHYLRFVNDHLEISVALDKASLNRFLPFRTLQQYFTEDGNERLINLVSSLCPSPNYHPEQIVEAIVRNEYMIAFATLLQIGEGHHINQITKYDKLNDASMPFTSTHRPDGFPLSSQGDMYERFKRQQWMFLAAKIESRSKNIESERILPFMKQSPLGFGGSGQTYLIEVHPEYNRLKAIQGSPYGLTPNNQLVLKTYHEHEVNSYHSETNAYQHLRSQHYSRVKAFIHYHGSFERESSDGTKTFNIILEYADGGNMENMFQHETPPQTPQEIAGFWLNLLEVVQALDALHITRIDSNRDHYLNGWHQDITPQNILLAKNGCAVHQAAFKVADLGLAHFRPRDGVDAVATDRQGTKTFGAPECYREDVFSRSAPRNISPAVDVWSLGAVFSESIMWVVGGLNLLNEYRLSRRLATQNITGHRDIQSFHDSNGNVLPCVVEWHRDKIPPRIARGDTITDDVLELVHAHMLVADGGRAHMGAVNHQWKQLKPYAESCARGSTSGVIPSPANPSRRRRTNTSHQDARSSPPKLSTDQPDEEDDEEPPDWPRGTADSWLQKRIGNNYTEKVPDPAISQELVGRDHVFMIDNSCTMHHHWSEVTQLVRLLSEILFARGADDKIEVMLVSGTENDGKPKDGERSGKTSRGLRDFVEGRLPPETHTRRLNVGLALDRFLTGYQDRISKKGLFSKLQKDPKPLSLYILTDGRYQKESDLKSPIEKMVNKLNALGKPKNDVGIQFIQLGDHRRGSERLADLDTFSREKGLWSDIVDTEPASRNVWKMLLGAINPTFDNDKHTAKDVERCSSGSWTEDGYASPSSHVGPSFSPPQKLADRADTDSTIRPHAPSKNRLSALLKKTPVGLT